jgi:hypothetical protein
LLASLLFSAALATAGQAAKKGIDASYQFAIGDRSRPVRSGIVWLYHYSWYGLHSYKLATIEDGVTHIRLTEEELESEVKPHSDTEAYVLVLQLPPNLWYRTRDIAPDSLWGDLLPGLNALGTARVSPSGETLVVLSAPTLRQLVLQHEDGRPAVNLEVPVSIYLYDRNHCGHHRGLPLGTFLTDRNGAIEFPASPLPLYLDIRFYDRQGESPAGPAYSAVVGLKSSSEPDIVLRRAWNLPVQELEVRVLDSDGSPLQGLSVNQEIRAGECGAWWGQVAQTDAEGAARLAIAPAVTERLWLSNREGTERPLTEAELKALFAQRRLVFTW